MTNEMDEGAAVSEEDSIIPYAPDFTSETLGKRIGHERVLPWLVETAATVKTRDQLQDAIADTCLAHIEDSRNRRDMASHVVQGLGNYRLIDVAEDDSVVLTPEGQALRGLTGSAQLEYFARHILTRCNGMRLVDAIRTCELTGVKPTLEVLSEKLDLPPTSKVLSTMRHWLSRARVLPEKGAYKVDDRALERLLGPGVKQLAGLSEPELEFVLAARIIALANGEGTFDAPDARKLAETRNPEVRIPSKALGSFIKKLAAKGLLRAKQTGAGKGGQRTTAELTLAATHATDDQIRSFLQQSSAGFYLPDLKPIPTVLSQLARGSTDERGQWGEMLGVHVCLMLGLRVVSWRSRLPVEIDLIAERTVGFSYQRWHIQVKNIDGNLDSDRVDREIGAAAGTGATHLLFIVPRGGVTQPARAEMLSKNRITHLHIFTLAQEALEKGALISLINSLEGQLLTAERHKRGEALRRESFN